MQKIKTEKECLEMIKAELNREDISNTRKVWNASMMISCFNTKVSYQEHMSLSKDSKGKFIGMYFPS